MAASVAARSCAWGIVALTGCQGVLRLLLQLSTGDRIHGTEEGQPAIPLPALTSHVGTTGV